MLQIIPEDRMTIKEILQHEWIRENNPDILSSLPPLCHIKPIKRMIRTLGKREISTANQIMSPFIKQANFHKSYSNPFPKQHEKLKSMVFPRIITQKINASVQNVKLNPTSQISVSPPKSLRS
jgi:hypothetical protein